ELAVAAVGTGDPVGVQDFDLAGLLASTWHGVHPSPVDGPSRVDRPGVAAAHGDDRVRPPGPPDGSGVRGTHGNRLAVPGPDVLDQRGGCLVTHHDYSYIDDCRW